EGGVAISNSKGAQKITAGQECVIKKGIAPTTPSPILAHDVWRGQKGLLPVENLLTDPGFENGWQGWHSGNREGWASVVHAPVHSGTSALQMHAKNVALGEMFQNIEVHEGETYEASGWMK